MSSLGYIGALGWVHARERNLLNGHCCLEFLPSCWWIDIHLKLVSQQSRLRAYHVTHQRLHNKNQ